MATQNVTAQAEESNTPHDWKSERQEMATLIKQNILDPFALIAGMLTEMDTVKNLCPDPDEVGRLLSLMVMGAHSELGMYLTFGCHISSPMTNIIETAFFEGEQGNTQGGVV